MQMPDDAFLELSGKLDRFAEKLNGVSVDVAEIKSEVKDVADHEKRIRDLEQFRWKLAGSVLVITIVVPILVSIVVKYIMGA